MPRISAGTDVLPTVNHRILPKPAHEMTDEELAESIAKLRGIQTMRPTTAQRAARGGRSAGAVTADPDEVG